MSPSPCPPFLSSPFVRLSSIIHSSPTDHFISEFFGLARLHPTVLLHFSSGLSYTFFSTGTFILFTMRFTPSIVAVVVALCPIFVSAAPSTVSRRHTAASDILVLSEYYILLP